MLDLMEACSKTGDAIFETITEGRWIGSAEVVIEDGERGASEWFCPID